LHGVFGKDLQDPGSPLWKHYVMNVMDIVVVNFSLPLCW